MVNTYCCNIIVYSRARGLRLRVWNLNRNLLHRPRATFNCAFFHVSSSFHVVFVLLCFAFSVFCMEPAPIECAEPAPKSVGRKNALYCARRHAADNSISIQTAEWIWIIVIIYWNIKLCFSRSSLSRFCVEDFSCKITMRKIDWRFQRCATEKNLSPTLHLHRAHFFLPSICAIQRWRQRKTTWIARPLIYILFSRKYGTMEFRPRPPQMSVADIFPMNESWFW